MRPASIRLLACKRSWDGEALIVRLQEAVGRKTKARLDVTACAAKTEKEEQEERGHVPEGYVPQVRVPTLTPGRTLMPMLIPLVFGPLEIKTLRVERDGTWRPVRMIN